jgi:hypothetical protein
MRADRIGLVLCAKPKVALTELAQAEAIGQNPFDVPYLQQLMNFAISDEYNVLYNILWTTSQTSELTR